MTDIEVRRPYQGLNQSTPRTAWELLAHTPASQPLALTVLQSKAAQYRQVRKLKDLGLGRATVTVSKSGKIIDDGILSGKDSPKADNQMLVDVTSANRQVYHQGYQVGCRRRSADASSTERSPAMNSCSRIRTPVKSCSPFRCR